MGRDNNRFASDGVFHALPPLPRAVVFGRLSNPRGQGLAPARLVSVVDTAIQDALEESPIVLWETEETIRFELPEARVILTLADADEPGAAGLGLTVIFEGENAPEIARALSRLVLRTIETRYPAFQAEDIAPPLDEDTRALAAQPLSGSLPVLAPVETLEDAMWCRAQVSQKRDKPEGLPAPQSLWRRLLAARLPGLAPMRPSVRALALILFAMGLAQVPQGQSAQAQASVKTASSAP